MKKSKLIELLQKIEGDPEIYLWNGLVSDWMDISSEFTESELVKYSKDFLFDHLKLEWCKDNNTFDVPDEVLQTLMTEAEKIRSKSSWDFPNRFVEEAEMERWYGKYKKRVILIDGKRKGATYSDRLGDIKY